MTTRPSQTVKDASWVRNSFMVPTHALDIMTTRGIRNYTSVGQKFTDTTIGGNFAINPPPQHTAAADMISKGVNPMSRGMGRKYSEMFDDNSQLIHMRFGVPQFNSMMSFFSGFYDGAASIMSRTGRAPSTFYYIGRAAGFVITLPIAPLILAGRVYRFLANKPSSKFYYMKPTMPLYWNAANTILNGIAVNEGMVPRVYSDDQLEIMEGEENFGPQDQARFHDAINSILPGVYTKRGGIDIYAVATRGQRLADAARRQQAKIIEESRTIDEMQENFKKYVDECQFRLPPRQFNDGEDAFNAYMNAWNQTAAAQVSAGESSSGSDNAEENQSWYRQFRDHAEAAIRDGSEFVTFRVQHTGESSESFSNSVGQSEIAGKVNGSSSSARSKRFSFADGNIGNVAGKVVESAKQLVEGLADSLNISGLMAVLGNAYADIPQEWKDSSVNLPSKSYTIELRSPYGNHFSRMQNLWVPLSMLLAAVLPKSVGKHAYDMPFLVEIYDKGRAQSRLAMITEMTITRGVGNLGWTQDHRPLGINVTFSLTDLSEIMHMPINGAPGLFDEDNTYTDYLAVLGSLSLADQFYVSNRLRIRLARKMEEFRSWTSPARVGIWAAGTFPGRTLRAMTRETTRAAVTNGSIL